MNLDTAYYRAAGRSLDRIHEWQQGMKEFRQQVDEMKQEVGAENVYTWDSHSGIAGFTFPDNVVPEGWRRIKKTGLCWPLRRSPEGKALAKRIESVEGPSFERLLGCNELMIVGNRWRSLGLDPINDGEQYVITVPLDEDGKPFFEPEDAERLKPSEYFALRGE